MSYFVAALLNLVNIKQTILTDSRCVIEWYKSGKESKRFKLERIKEIRNYDGRIGYVKSGDNPADIASQGTTIIKSKDCSLRWKGPDWLNDGDDIPDLVNDLADYVRNGVKNEEKGSKIFHEVSMVANVSNDVSPFEINEVSSSS